jgi:metallo-beta-lactamase family protein
MNIQFCGAARTVTGSAYLVTAAGHKVLVDCGMFQGSKAIAEFNYGAFPFDPTSLQAVLLTHAHIDHSGLLPKLTKLGFHGPIYTTEVTRDLCKIMLPDSAYIQESEVERKNRKLARQDKPLLEPIYTVADAHACMNHFKVIPYGQRFTIVPGLEAILRPSGHVLGSAYVELIETRDGSRTKLLVSGDIGAENRPLVPDPDDPGSADYVVMEATYGDRERDEKKDANILDLSNIIKETFKRGGNVIIPAFAVERTQDLLYGLNQLIYRGELSAGAVYVDSPLAIEATEVFARHVDHFDEEAQHFRSLVGDIPILFPNLHFSRTRQESEAINRIKSGAVIISANGMCTAGRIKHHLKHNLWRPECSIVFVGYLAEGSLGRQIQEGRSTVRIHGEEVRVRAQIHSLGGFSAHADQGGLVEWATSFEKPPKGIFLVHGEDHALNTLRELLQAKLSSDIQIPGYLAEYTLDQTPLELEHGEILAAVNSLSPTLWSATSRLLAALQELERSQLPQHELERLLVQTEELRAEVEKAIRRQSVA